MVNTLFWWRSCTKLVYKECREGVQIRENKPTATWQYSKYGFSEILNKNGSRHATYYLQGGDHNSFRIELRDQEPIIVPKPLSIVGWIILGFVLSVGTPAWWTAWKISQGVNSAGKWFNSSNPRFARRFIGDTSIESKKEQRKRELKESIERREKEIKELQEIIDAE